MRSLGWPDQFHGIAALGRAMSIKSYGALKKLVDRHIGGYDPFRLAFGQRFPGAAYYCLSLVKYLSRHERRLFFLTNRVDSWHLFLLPLLPHYGVASVDRRKLADRQIRVRRDNVVGFLPSAGRNIDLSRCGHTERKRQQGCRHNRYCNGPVHAILPLRGRIQLAD